MLFLASALALWSLAEGVVMELSGGDGGNSSHSSAAANAWPAASARFVWIMHSQCSPLKWLGWPYDVWRPLRYECGLGPVGDSAEAWRGTTRLIEASTFLELMGRNGSLSPWCMLTIFYSPTCPFSAKMAPALNALGRLFPRLRVAALDATQRSPLNTRYGIHATPTILFWANGRAVARFDESLRGEAALPKLLHFLADLSDLPAPPAENATILREDEEGPLEARVRESRDWYLLLAWLVLAAWAAWALATSEMGKRTAAALRRSWREAGEAPPQPPSPLLSHVLHPPPPPPPPDPPQIQLDEPD